MLIHRTLACLVVAASLVSAPEARASCIDPSSCLCPAVPALNATFAGTILDVAPAEGASSGNVTASVHLDTIALAGASTTLAVGATIPVLLPSSPARVRVGVRVVGISTKACEGPSEDCTPGPELAQVVRVADEIGLIECRGAVLAASPDTLAELMARPSCSSDVNRLLDDAGVDTGCCDVGPCTAKPGPIPSTGWAGLFGVAVLIGRRFLRRRSAVTS